MEPTRDTAATAAPPTAQKIQAKNKKRERERERDVAHLLGAGRKWYVPDSRVKHTDKAQTAGPALSCMQLQALA